MSQFRNLMMCQDTKGPYLPPVTGNSSIDSEWQTDLNECLCFEGETTFTISGITTSMLFVYSTDGKKWYEIDNTVSSTSLDITDKLYLMGVNPNGVQGLKFSFSNVISLPEVTGNIMSLIGLNKTEIPVGYCFEKLFYDCPIISAPRLPATTLTFGCYSDMFRYCDYLEEAPDLPATTTQPYCYNRMFYCCYSLKRTPHISATSLANFACEWMFKDCYDLTTITNWDVTGHVGYYACEMMFDSCGSLTTPMKVLPSTSLDDSAYESMFINCRSLVQTPYLPATTLSDSCYFQMFYNCTNLRYTQDILPATTGVDYCYCAMFSGCTNLTHAPKIALQDFGNYTRKMFLYCDSLVWVAANWTIPMMVNSADTSFITQHTSTNGKYYGNMRSEMIPSGWSYAGSYSSTLDRGIQSVNSNGDLV